MVFHRLLGRLSNTAENFDGVLLKTLPFCTSYFFQFKSITLNFKKFAIEDNTENRNYTQLLKHNSKYSRYARQKNEAISHDKYPQNLEPSPKQKKSPKEVSPMCYIYSETVKDSLQNTKPAFVMFHDQNTKPRKNTKPEFLKTLSLLVEEFLIAFGAVFEKMLVRYDTIGSPNSDSICYFDKLTEDHGCGIKEAEFVSFLHSQSTAYQMAKNAQEAGFGGSVVLLFDDNFENAIADPKPTFVMFYASFCDHCVAAKPAYSKLATTLKGEGKMRAVAIDAADNPKVADLASVQTLPTFKIYKAGKMIEDYTGDRSYDDFLSFCKKHA